MVTTIIPWKRPASLPLLVVGRGGVKVDGFAGQLDRGIMKDMVDMDNGFPSSRGGGGINLQNVVVSSFIVRHL